MKPITDLGLASTISPPNDVFRRPQPQHLPTLHSDPFCVLRCRPVTEPSLQATRDQLFILGSSMEAPCFPSKFGIAYGL